MLFPIGGRRIYNRLDEFYVNKYTFKFKKDEGGSCIKVIPYTLFDHHPIVAKISTNDSSLAPRSKKDGFALNTKLLEDEDVLSAICIIRHFNSWIVELTSVVDRWVQNTKS